MRSPPTAEGDPGLGPAAPTLILLLLIMLAPGVHTGDEAEPAAVDGRPARDRRRSSSPPDIGPVSCSWGKWTLLPLEVFGRTAYESYMRIWSLPRHFLRIQSLWLDGTCMIYSRVVDRVAATKEGRGSRSACCFTVCRQTCAGNAPRRAAFGKGVRVAWWSLPPPS